MDSTRNTYIANRITNEVIVVESVEGQRVTGYTAEAELVVWLIPVCREATGWEIMNFHSENSNWITAADMEEAFA